AKYGANDARTARCLHELGKVLNQLGRTRDALPFLERAIAIAEQIDPHPPTLSDYLAEVGFAQYHQQRYEPARTAIERALELREQLFGTSSPEVAQSLHDLASVQHALAHFPQSEALEQRALRIAQASLPAGHPLVVNITHTLGTLYLDQGDYEHALPLLERAAELTDSSSMPVPDRVVALRDLARALDDQGQGKRAHAMAEQALVLGEEGLSPDHPFLWSVHLLLGGMDRREGRYESALEHFRHALEVCEATFTADSANVATILAERAT